MQRDRLLEKIFRLIRLRFEAGRTQKNYDQRPNHAGHHEADKFNDNRRGPEQRLAILQFRHHAADQIFCVRY